RGEIMRTLLRILLVSALLAAPSLVEATDANLDPSFGTYGSTALDPTNGFDIGADVAIQPDGRIVVAGTSTVARLLSDGSSDPTFGVAGIATMPANTGASAVAIQSDGGIVLAGVADVQADTKMGVVRMTALGTVDPTFGTAGVTRIEV